MSQRSKQFCKGNYQYTSSKDKPQNLQYHGLKVTGKVAVPKQPLQRRKGKFASV